MLTQICYYLFKSIHTPINMAAALATVVVAAAAEEDRRYRHLRDLESELDAANQKQTHLESELQTAHKERDDAWHQVKKLKHDLQHFVTQHKQEVDQLNEQLNNCYENFESNQNALANLKEGYDKLWEEQTKILTENQALQNALKTAQEETVKSKQEFEDLMLACEQVVKNQEQNHQQAIKDMYAKIADKDSELNTAQKEMVKSKQEFEDLMSTCEQVVKKQEQNHQQAIENMYAKMYAKMLDFKESILQSIVSTQHYMTVLQRQMEELKTEYQTQNIDDMMNDLAELKAKLDEVSEIGSEFETCNFLQTELGNARQEIARIRTDHKTQIASYELAKQEDDATIRAQQQEIEKLNKAIKYELEQHQRDLRERDEMWNQSHTACYDLKKALENDYKKLQQQLQFLKDKYEKEIVTGNDTRPDNVESGLDLAMEQLSTQLDEILHRINVYDNLDDQQNASTEPQYDVLEFDPEEEDTSDPQYHKPWSALTDDSTASENPFIVLFS